MPCLARFNYSLIKSFYHCFYATGFKKKRLETCGNYPVCDNFEGNNSLNTQTNPVFGNRRYTSGCQPETTRPEFLLKN